MVQVLSAHGRLASPRSGPDAVRREAGGAAAKARVFCHAGSARMIRAHYLGLGPSETVYYTPDNSGVLRLSADALAQFES